MERRIGELAAATGLTVRTLHYYEEIGLLPASARSDAGHRRYTTADVERLYRICRLRNVGLSLGDIARVLDDPAWSLREAMSSHLAAVEERLAGLARLRSRLHGLLDTAPSDDALRDDELLHVLEEMTSMDTVVQQRITYLVYRDIEAAYEHLTGVFGLGPGKLERDGDGRVVHAEIQAGDGVIWLHPENPEFALAAPSTAGVATAGVAVMVDDVDAHYRRCVEHGVRIAQEPVDQDYGYRVHSAWDPEGGLWSFMRALG